METRHIDLALVAAGNHVEVHVESDAILRHWRVGHERARTLEADLLGVQCGDDETVAERLSDADPRDLEQGGNAGRVVVGARVDAAVTDTDVVVVRGQHDHRKRRVGACTERQKVGTLRRSRRRISALGGSTARGDRERLLEALGPSDEVRGVAADRARHARALAPPGVPAARPS